MNILIVTGHFGLGHVSAAHAIKRVLENQHDNLTIEVIDLFEYLSPHTSKKMYELFNFWTRYTPRLYNRINAVSCHVNSLPLSKKTFKKLDALLATHATDIVISTLPFCTKCMSAFKEMTKRTFPLYTYVTDVVAHEEWLAPCVDEYYVASHMTKKWLTSYGVSAEKVRMCGIPLTQELASAPKTSLSEGGANQKEILIMGGGLGLIPLERTFYETLSRAQDVHVTVITGKNRALQEKLEANFPNLEVVGFTPEAQRYMKRASLIVTKPGGITTLEAISAQTPLFALKPFLAQEVGNAAFICDEQIGRVAQCGGAELANDVLALVRDDAALGEYKCAMARLSACWQAEQRRIATAINEYLRVEEEPTCA